MKFQVKDLPDHLLPDQPGVHGSPHIIGINCSSGPVDAYHVAVLLCNDENSFFESRLTTARNERRISLAQTLSHEEPKPWMITLVGEEALKKLLLTVVTLLYSRT